MAIFSCWLYFATVVKDNTVFATFSGHRKTQTAGNLGEKEAMNNQVLKHEGNFCSMDSCLSWNWKIKIALCHDYGILAWI